MALEKTIRIKVDSSGAERNVDSLDDSMKGLGKTADQTEKSFGKLKTTVIAVAAALQVRQIAQYADAFTSIQNQIRQTTTTTEQLNKRTMELIEVSKRSRIELLAVSELYTQITLNTEDLGLSTEKVLRLTETISKSFAIQGKSAAESAGAMRQLNQAFSRGQLRGDEFNSVVEGAPELARALRKSLKLTQGQLIEFAAQGGITSEVLITGLTEAADVIDKKMSESTKTLAQSFQEAEINAIAFVGASDLVTTSMGAAGESIVFLSENLDTIANVLLVSVAAGLSKLTAGFILNTIQVVRSTTVMGAATVAATSLGRAMAFLGGPLGVVLTAASAIAIFAVDAGEAKTPAMELTEQVDKLSKSFSGFNEQQRAAKISNNTARIIAMGKAAADLEVTIKNLEQRTKQGAGFGQRGNFNERNLEQSRKKLEEIRVEIKKLETESEALFKVGIDKALEGATDQSGLTPTAQKKPKDNFFVNNERFKTESLKAQLNERLAVQRAFNNTALTEFATLAEQERAIVEFNRQVDIAALEKKKVDAALDFEQRREALLLNTKLDAEAKLLLTSELEQQELIQKQIFEDEKTNIEADAAAERAAIARRESQDKINSIVGFTQSALSFEAAFASKSEKAQKKRRKVQVIVDTAAGIQRAFAEHDYFTATGISLAIAANGKNQLDAIDSSSGISGSSGSASTQTEAAPRQEPIQQSTAIEFRGLSEVAAALENLDPDEVLPVEFTQRIVASLDEFNRISGEGG